MADIVVQVKVDEAQRDEIIATLGSMAHKAPQVMSSALNKTADWVRTRAIRALTTHLNIQRKALEQTSKRYRSIDVIRASRSRLAALVSVTGRRIPLSRFGARQAYGKGDAGAGFGERAGITYKIERSGSRKYIKEAFFGRGRRGRVESAAEATSGHMGVWRRRGRSRLPIIQLFGPSAGQAASNMPSLHAELTGIDASNKLLQNIASQVDRVLASRGGGASPDA